MRFIAALVLASLSVPAAQACSCEGGWTPERAFDAAHVVFLGTAISEGPSDLWIAPSEPLRATTFEVAETFKDDWALQDSGRISLADREDSCATSFEVGRQYLIFAWRTEGHLPVTSLCAGNELVADASDTLARVRAVAADWTRPAVPVWREGDEGALEDAQGATQNENEFPWWSVGLNVALVLALLWSWTRRRAPAS